MSQLSFWDRYKYFCFCSSFFELLLHENKIFETKIGVKTKCVYEKSIVGPTLSNHAILKRQTILQESSTDLIKDIPDYVIHHSYKK